MSPSTKRISITHWMDGRTIKGVILSGVLLALLPCGFVPDSLADFSLNWQQDYRNEGASFVDNDAYFCDGFSYMSCNGGGGSGWGGSRGSGGSNDNSAFLQETLRLDGETYFHLIVGDYTKDSMATEVFIHVSSGNNSRDGITFSDSLCNNCIQDRNFDASDALNSNSDLNGNGGGNPNSVIMHQIIQDGAIKEDFLKDSFSQKPLITQTLTTSDMTSELSMDMRGKNYSDITPIDPSKFNLTQSVQGANSQGTSGDFDIHTNGQLVNLTAGGFTYTPTSTTGGSSGGGGWGGSRDSSSGGSSGGGGGTYTYVDGGFQPLNFDYAVFCDPSQNSGVSGSGDGGWGGFRSSNSSGDCGGLNSDSSGGGGWGGSR